MATESQMDAAIASFQESQEYHDSQEKEHEDEDGEEANELNYIAPTIQNGDEDDDEHGMAQRMLSPPPSTPVRIDECSNMDEYESFITTKSATALEAYYKTQNAIVLSANSFNKPAILAHFNEMKQKKIDLPQHSPMREFFSRGVNSAWRAFTLIDDDDEKQEGDDDAIEEHVRLLIKTNKMLLKYLKTRKICADAEEKMEILLKQINHLADLKHEQKKRARMEKLVSESSSTSLPKKRGRPKKSTPTKEDSDSDISN